MTNDYYYYLNLPFSFNKELPDFADKAHLLYAKDDFPLLESWLNSLGLTIRHAEVFRKFNGWPEIRHRTDKATIHVDGKEFDNHTKLNFVYGSGTSKLVWYKLKPGCAAFSDHSGAYTPSISAWPDDCYEVESALTNRPMIINAGQLHDVRDVNETRFCFSFQLAPVNDPTAKVNWSEVTEYFKEFIV